MGKDTIFIKGKKVHREDISVLSIYAPNAGAHTLVNIKFKKFPKIILKIW